MRTLWWITTVTGTALLCSHFAMQFRPSSAAQWFVIAVLPMFGFTMLASLIGLIKYQRALGSKVFYPFLMCGVFLLLVPTARNKGLDARLAAFRQRLPEYEETVTMIRESQNVQSGKPASFVLPPSMRYLAYKIEVDRRPEGPLHILFYYGSGIPNRHYAYLYSSTDRPGAWPGLARWPGVEKVTVNWYRVRN